METKGWCFGIFVLCAGGFGGIGDFDLAGAHGAVADTSGGMDAPLR